MSHTYCSNRIHLIFSTKERQKSLSEELQPKLWAYMAGIAHNQGFQAIAIGGIEDHIHALLLLPPTLPLAKAVQFLKGSSSKWINDTQAMPSHSCVARGLRRIQRQCFTDIGCRSVYQRPAVASREEDFRG
jgi:REP element-mobilizing transposase RayT